MRRILLVIAVLAAFVAGFSIATPHSQSPTIIEQVQTFDDTTGAEITPFNLSDWLEPRMQAQMVASFGGIHRLFASQNATGATAALSAKGIITNHTIGLVVTGSPTGCTYRLQGSRDGSTWFNISAADITCTATIAAYETGKPFPTVRGNLLTLSGGTAPTVRMHYVGK